MLAVPPYVHPAIVTLAIPVPLLTVPIVYFAVTVLKFVVSVGVNVTVMVLLATATFVGFIFNVVLTPAVVAVILALFPAVYVIPSIVVIVIFPAALAGEPDFVVAVTLVSLFTVTFPLVELSVNTGVAFAVVIVIVFVACATVVVLAIVAVITLLPELFSAVIVVPLIDTFAAVPLEYVILPGVPPLPLAVAVTVAVFLYASVVFVGDVKLNVLVFFFTGIVTSTLFAL